MGIAMKLSRFFPAQEVGNGRGNVFFVRYTLLKTRWFATYLHRFYRGDMDRCLHDHPWAFLSVVLWGGYWEEMQVMRFTRKGVVTHMTDKWWRGPGSILYRTADTAHRITLDESRPHPLSLVFVGRKVRPWGFWTVSGWVAWAKGQGNPICETK